MAKVVGTYGNFGLIPNHMGGLLLVRRSLVVAGKPDGRWNLPGGGVDSGDVEEKRSPESVVLREVSEETGLEVKVADYRPVGVYATATHSDVAITWLCKVVGGNLRKTDEGVDAAYFTPSEIMDLARKGDISGGLVGGLKTSTGGVPRHILMCMDYFTRVGDIAFHREEALRFLEELHVRP